MCIRDRSGREKSEGGGERSRGRQSQIKNEKGREGRRQSQKRRGEGDRNIEGKMERDIEQR